MESDSDQHESLAFMGLGEFPRGTMHCPNQLAMDQGWEMHVTLCTVLLAFKRFCFKLLI